MLNCFNGVIGRDLINLMDFFSLVMKLLDPLEMMQENNIIIKISLIGIKLGTTAT